MDEEIDIESSTENVIDKEKKKLMDPPRVLRPFVPYTHRLLQGQIDYQYRKFIELIKQLRVYLPFI